MALATDYIRSTQLCSDIEEEIYLRVRAHIALITYIMIWLRVIDRRLFTPLGLFPHLTTVFFSSLSENEKKSMLMNQQE